MWRQGNTSFSNTVQLKIPLKTDNALTISPNPFDKGLQMKFEKVLVGKAFIQITNMVGKEVWTSELQMNSRQIDLPTLPLPAGVYILRIQHEQKIWTKMIVKK